MIQASPETIRRLYKDRKIHGSVLLVDRSPRKAISAAFNPEEPRNDEGEWTRGGGVLGSLIPATADRKQWPEHLKSIKPPIPPAYDPATKRGWKDIVINPDPTASLIASGIDTKGRRQYVYSKDYAEAQAQQKFERVKEMSKMFGQLEKQNQDNLSSSDKLKQEHALVTDLIMKYGLRPGSETDTGAKRQAYGATTLEGRHVVQSEKTGKVWLKFVGKKGVDISLSITDKETAQTLVQRAKSIDRKEQLFPNVSAASLSQYVHELDSGKFKTKDFRTLLGTKTALDVVNSGQIKTPTKAKEYKKAVMAVGKAVAEKLGNTPSVALKSYISPEIFTEWRAKAGV